MKITELSITIEPNEIERENGIETRRIFRTPLKLWNSLDKEGLYPNEIKLANDIQDVIARYNGNQK